MDWAPPPCPQGPAAPDPAQPVGAEAAVLEVAPAVHLAEHRPEAAVRHPQPISKRPHWAGTHDTLALEGQYPLGLIRSGEVRQDELDPAGIGQAHLLAVEAAQLFGVKVSFYLGDCTQTHLN